MINFPVGAKPGAIDSDTLLSLDLLDGPIAIIPGLIAIGFYLQYRLTKERHAEIQEQLRQRHSSS